MKILSLVILVSTIVFVLIKESDNTKSSDVASPQYTVGCLYDHLQASIELNRDRRSRYEVASMGKSFGLSTKWVILEHAAKVPALYLDLQARDFQKAGIPILCNDLPSMSSTPEYVDETAPANIRNFKEVNYESLRVELEDAFLFNDFDLLYQVSLHHIAELKKQPQFNCLTRHTLESIAIHARNAPKYIKMAERLSLESTETISRNLIKLHFKALWQTAKLDREAAVIQADGIPIICQDVPAIDFHWPNQQIAKKSL